MHRIHRIDVYTQEIHRIDAFFQRFTKRMRAERFSAYNKMLLQNHAYKLKKSQNPRDSPDRVVRDPIDDDRIPVKSGQRFRV